MLLKPALRATAVLAVVATLAAPAAWAAPAPESVPEPAATSLSAPVASAADGLATSDLTGRARLGYPVETEAVRVTVEAHATFGPGSFPTRSWGTFRISHVIDGKDYWGDFAVDCLTTGGPTATVTGRLQRTSPGHPWREALDAHTRMGLSFYVPRDGAGGPARVGLSGATLKKQPLLTKCMSSAADMPVVEGGYTLGDRHV
ncbi:hypothetical protein SLA_1232 [Streptomyces laurentii]|uniref:Secreted protein n=1 Tax=Streptomyces laurentii TaxID=39478 RepID=A0A160NVY0_STRLU|nr:hypothetical protein SLA_1232 [Streptomyces laurentii]